MLRRPKAILFDLDDTIITFGTRHDTFVDVAKNLSGELGGRDPVDVGDEVERVYGKFWSDPDNYAKYRYDPLAARIEVATQIFGPWGLADDLPKRFGEEFDRLRDQRMHSYPGAVQFLQTLKAAGMKLGLISNGAGPVQREKIDKFALAQLFDVIQIEEEVGYGKPEERAYRDALHALGVRADECWMVGDNLQWEVAAPQRLGMVGIWVDLAGKGVPAGSNVKPDQIVRSISAIQVPA